MTCLPVLLLLKVGECRSYLEGASEGTLIRFYIRKVGVEICRAMAHEKEVPVQTSVSKYNHVKTLSCKAFGRWRRCSSLVSDKQDGLQEAQPVRGELRWKTRQFPFGLFNLFVLASPVFSI